MSLTEKKHLYLISSNKDLLKLFKPLEDQYLISVDATGRLLRKLKKVGDKPNIDLIFTEIDFFQKKKSLFIDPESAAISPYFAVFVPPEKVNALADIIGHAKFYPVFTPVSIDQLKFVITALIQNHQKTLALEEREHYKILFQKAPMVQLLLNPCDFVILDANQTATELYGKSDQDSLLGLAFADLHPLQRNDLLEKLVETVREGESHFVFNFNSPTKGMVDLAAFFGEIFFGKKKLIAVNIQDITASRKAEHVLKQKNIELEKTNSELDNFVYSTSHELRAPLMSVLGLINLLENENDSKEKELYIGLMKESIKKLDYTIHDFIDYSQNARFQVKVSPVDFNFLLEKALNNLKYLPGAEKVAVHVIVNQQKPFFSDKRRVEIILNNLISNSLRYYNPDTIAPFVEILVETNEARAEIRVTDNGCGIPEKHIPRVFEMFFRGHEQSTGSGIGLYIVREIVDKLNGEIFFESADGKGTVFNLKIPNQIQNLENGS